MRPVNGETGGRCTVTVASLHGSIDGIYFSNVSVYYVTFIITLVGLIVIVIKNINHAVH